MLQLGLWLGAGNDNFFPFLFLSFFIPLSILLYILLRLQGIDIIIQHVESKPSKENPGQEFTFLLQCECFLDIKSQLEIKLKSVGATSITIKDHGTANNINNWINCHFIT